MTTAMPPPSASPAALVAAHASARAGHEAVVTPRTALTFGELAAHAAGVRGALGRLRGGAVAGLSVEQGWEQVVAMLGALGAGVAWLPIDPRLSQGARWERLIDHGVEAVLTQSWLAEQAAWPDAVEAVAVDALGPANAPPGDGPEADPVACLIPDPDGGGPAFVLRTAALSNTVVGLAQRIELGPGDRLLSLAPAGSDLAIAELLATAAAGATAVVPDPADARDAAALARLLASEWITVWASPAALATQLVDAVADAGTRLPECLRLMLLVRERVPVALTERIRALAPPGLRVAFGGGVAAGGILSAVHDAADLPTSAKQLPMGRPLANQSVHVLGDDMAPRPVWVTGRVHFGGASLADGRWGDSGRTRDAVGEERLVRSDLLGRVLDDGSVEAVGDDRSRGEVRGHPVNTRDIELVLAAHDAVRDAAVGLVDGALVAHVAARGPGVREALEEHLRRKVSPYLLPERLEIHERLPLADWGGLDREALAAASARAPEQARANAAPAARELVERLCSIAADVLAVPAVEPGVNLLDLGATSMALVRLGTRIEEELGLQVDIEELLRFPTISVVAARLAPEAADAAPPPAPGGDATAELITDPVDRQAFKDRRPALRRELELGAAVELSPLRPEYEAIARRRTVRSFAPAEVPEEALSRLLGALREVTSGGEPKRWYPSAGGLHAVQAYVEVRAGRVQDVAAGAYYHHPVQHRLLTVAAGAQLDSAAHAWINRDAARSAAFAVHLVADMDAIVPMYGTRAWDYCLLEAGGMAHLLMSVAPEARLGLCQIGEIEERPVRELLALDPRHRHVHALLGGILAEDHSGA